MFYRTSNLKHVTFSVKTITESPPSTSYGGFGRSGVTFDQKLNINAILQMQVRDWIPHSE